SDCDIIDERPSAETFQTTKGAAAKIEAASETSAPEPASPPPAPEQEQGRRRPKPSREDFAAWYQKRYAEWPKGEPPPGRLDDEIDAGEFFKCKGLRELVREYRPKIAPEWTEGGPNGSNRKSQRGTIRPRIRP